MSDAKTDTTQPVESSSDSVSVDIDTDAQSVAASPMDGEQTSSSDELSALLQQIDALQREVQQRKDEILRGRAELENYRKRVQREKDELRKNAAAGLIEELLTVLDNMQLGLQSAEAHPEANVVTEGFRMVFGSLCGMLETHGLKELNPQGERFDPHAHACIAHQPSADVPEDHVMQVIRSGYALHDRLLRPANVVVSSGPAEEATKDKPDA